MDKFRQISTELLLLNRVGNWFQCSISRFFCRLPSNFACELIFKRSGLRLKMDKVRQISTELLPLIRVVNWFPYSISRIFGLLSSNFVYELIF